MQFRFVSILLVISIFALGSMLIFAQSDDQGDPNNPLSNGRANACYAGGSMEGKCDTEWEWEAGWYLIRFEYGLISREDFFAQYAGLLPAEVIPTEVEAVVSSTPVFVCGGPVYGSLYVKFGTSDFLASPVSSYSDSSCTTPDTLIFLNLVYTTAGNSAATNLCISRFSATTAALLGNNIYYCS